MCKLYVGEGRQRSLVSLECIGHAGDQQPVFDGIEARRTLGVAGAHFMLPAVAMCE